MPLLRAQQDRLEGLQKDRDSWPSAFASMQGMRQAVHDQKKELEREVMHIVL